ncbi:MAG: AAC(3) family N-acetyltransferase [Anaerolineae bacterium]|nr:AAC(3) family N-acetyltransferase [Anaerolineae bacterium]
MLTFDQLVTEFQAIGVQAGDVLLVHSAYKSLGGVDGGPQTVIDALLHVLGEDGTLIMPTFNFDFCKGAPWDVNETPSHMGIITELVRKDPRSQRVFHPIYSFAVIGAQAGFLTAERYKSSYERKSLFGKLCRLDGKIMVVGLPYNDSMTFFHHVEEIEGVDYRYLKTFTGMITDENGKTYEDSFQMLVRDIEQGVETMVDPMGALAEEAGLITVAQIGQAKVSLMNANQIYDFTAREMRRDPKLLYRIVDEALTSGRQDV